MTTKTDTAPARERAGNNHHDTNPDQAGAPIDLSGGGNTGITVLEREPDGHIVRTLITTGAYAVPATLIVSPKTGFARVDLRLSGADKSYLVALLSDLEVSEARCVHLRWDREDAEVWLRAESLCFGRARDTLLVLIQKLQRALRSDLFQALLGAAHKSEDGLGDRTEVAA